MGTEQKGHGSHSVESWVCSRASFDPLERWKIYSPRESNRTVYVHLQSILFPRKGALGLICGVVLTNTMTELFHAATKFSSILQLFSNQRTFFVISYGFFSILFARSEWSDNAANSMAFKLTYQLNLRLVDIQNKRWRTCVFVHFKIVFALLVAWRFIVLTGQRRIRISLSSKLLEYFGGWYTQVYNYPFDLHDMCQ